jgi:hypothetical protein
MIIIRVNAVEEEVRCVMRDGARGAKVEEMGGGVESFGPKGRGEVGVYEECANDIVCSTEKAFSFAILGRGVGAGEAEGYTMVGEEITEGTSEEFTTIITLHALDSHMKLSENKLKETLNSGTCIRFISQGEGP